MSHVAALGQTFGALVFQHTVAGTTYVCGVRHDDLGWRLIGFLVVGAANNVTVMQAAINSLTAGRTWIESVIIIGNYTINAVLSSPGYTRFELYCRIFLDNGSNCNMITNTNPGTDVQIEIWGGILDANKTNQGVDNLCIYIDDADFCQLYRVDMRNARRQAGTLGEGVRLNDCFWCTVSHCTAREHDYDGIKTTGGGNHIIANNQCYENHSGTAPNFTGGGGIQLALGTYDTVVIGNSTYCSIVTAVDYPRGVTLHDGDRNLICGNVFYQGATGVDLVASVGTTLEENQVIGNKMQACNFGIRMRDTGATGNVDRHDIFDNTIKSSLIGIHFRCATRDSNIEENKIFNHTMYGIGFTTRGNCTVNVIARNTIRDGVGDALYIAGITGCNYNWIFHNVFDNITGNAINIGANNNYNDLFLGNEFNAISALCLVDGGTGTILPTTTQHFAVALDGATIDGHGVLIDGDGEDAHTWLWLPYGVHQVVRMRIEAVARAATVNRMRMSFVIEGAADNENAGTHVGSIANLPSVTINFAAFDIIHYIINTAGLLAMLGGDSIRVNATFSVAGNGDIATNANVRTASIEYV